MGQGIESQTTHKFGRAISLPTGDNAMGVFVKTEREEKGNKKEANFGAKFNEVKLHSKTLYQILLELEKKLKFF